VYSVTIIGNVEQCRTEAEISDDDGTIFAAVYETSGGWHTDVVVRHLDHVADFQTAVEDAKKSHFFHHSSYLRVDSGHSRLSRIESDRYRLGRLSIGLDSVQVG
jgi:hypothetical protein